MVEMTVQFTFPGEGAIVFGELVTPDMPTDDSAISDMPSFASQIKKVCDGREDQPR
jgi:hypothetical protein